MNIGTRQLFTTLHYTTLFVVLPWELGYLVSVVDLDKLGLSGGDEGGGLLDGPNEGWGSNGLDLLLASVDDGGGVVVVLLGGGDGLVSTSKKQFLPLSSSMTL